MTEMAEDFIVKKVPLDVTGKEELIRKMIEKKRRELEDLEDMLPHDPDVEHERVHFDVVAFVSGTGDQREHLRDQIHTALALTKGVELVEIAGQDYSSQKA